MMGYISLLWNFFKLRKNTTKSKEEMLKLQNEKLLNILKYAYDNSKYYQREFREKGIKREDIDYLPLSSFPTIDKSILMKNFDELITTNEFTQRELREFDKLESGNHKKFKNKYYLVHSSGSTGKPVYFVYDESAWNQMLLAIIRGALWDMSNISILKLLIKGPRIAYIAATDGRYGGAMAVGSGIDEMHGKQLFIDINTPLDQLVESIKKFNPNIIIGYPSAIKILAEMVARKELHVNVSRVICCGEPLGTSLRKYMEEIFKSKVINFYGASESIALGVETSTTEGMYLFDDMNYIEVEDGEMYLTSLYNYIQPIIRYKISDKLVLRKTEENNKYPFTIVENIRGRNEDLLWFKKDEEHRDFLHPLAIEGFCIEGLLDYQFRQINEKRFEILAETSSKEKESFVEAELKEQLNLILKEKNLEYVNYSIQFTEKIMPDSKTGKKALVVKSTA